MGSVGLHDSSKRNSVILIVLQKIQRVIPNKVVLMK